MKTKLYMLTETSEFMMSFVVLTQRGNAIVVDGGREEDMPLLRQYVGGRRIEAWILTHPHSDHIGGFVSEMRKNGGADFDVGRVYYCFPDYEEFVKKPNVPDRDYFLSDLNEMLPAFLDAEPLFVDRAHIVRQGERITVDEVLIEFLYTGRDGLYTNPINDYSLVFKLTAPGKSVLFLGDLGPEGGEALLSESRGKLKADLVQMAHHGHMCVGREVYEAVAPTACLWCAPRWLYEEEQIPPYLADREKLRRMGRERMFGTALTRRWMDELGVATHYVTADGTQEIEL
ncbi:MAG: MBL fold metallo-hydrolase [Clostridia bacterium]|nr:MBL fold metallo-hydrolase [Clostridia bacterium]MBQ8859666.1 MBL fold metallo-hydrolase [Clostridia bacterium]